MPETDPDVIVLAIQAALSPVVERLAVAEAALARLRAGEKDVTDLRDRIVTVETKAAQPTRPEPVPVDLAPILERLAAAEVRIAATVPAEKALTDLRDRVVAIETKAAIPSAPDGDLRDRVLVLETKAAIPAVLPDMVPTEDIAALRERLAVIEAREAIPGPAGPPGKDGADGLTTEVLKDIGALRERVAVVEVRAQVPGPPGKDGASGKDGADGLGFDDLAVEFDGDRTIALKFERGSLKKTWPIVLPFQKYQGIYQQGKAYDVGDTVTFASHLWHCRDATITAPGDQSKEWVLCVRRGRDGKDGKDAVSLPVVSVGRST